MQCGKSIVVNMGVPADQANILMRNLLDSDEKGIHTHGIYRLQTYVTQMQRGNIAARPSITTVRSGNNVRVIDGDNGLGSVVSSICMLDATEMSHQRGVGIVAARRSNHFGTAAYYAEMAAARNQIGIVMTNASPAIAPTGSLKPLLGNNPWSISVPTNFGHPITLDIANSVVARGKIRLKALKGEPIPLGWALDSRGHPTTSAEEALKGIVLPIGDYKGYGITFMIDILAGVLTGAAFGDQVPLVDQDGIRNNGHLFISLDVEQFMGLSEFKAKIDELVHRVKSAPKISDDTEILLPGEREWQTKLNQDQGTVRLPKEILNGICSLCNEFKVPTLKATSTI